MSVPYPPPRSFQPRRRKLGPTRQASYDRLRPLFTFDVEGPVIHWAAGAVLDIGFGYGAALVDLARREPGQRVLGVEVHTPGVAHVLDAIEEHGLEHVRVVEGDVLELLARIGLGSLAGIRIWFPDPWPKARQQRRRLVRADVMVALVDRLRPGGFVHLATDIADGPRRIDRNQLDLAVNGRGFFQILLPDGTRAYSRDGSFQLSANGELVNSNGYALDPGITIPEQTQSVTIGADGTVSVLVSGESSPTEVGQLQLADFINPAGLQPMGENLFLETAASGDPQAATPGEDGVGTLVQGSLESSNVNVVEELVNMIETQRAYEMNSKAIATTDEMLAFVTNNL